MPFAARSARPLAERGPIGSGWNGEFYGAVDNVQIDFSGGRSLNSNFEVAASGAVPEPATWGMMILGFGMMGASVRYRRRSSKVAVA